MYSYHIKQVQERLPVDPVKRLFKMRESKIKSSIAIFFDEAFFTRLDVNNLHNEHVYIVENPTAMKIIHVQPVV